MTETLHIKDDESDIRLDIFVAERLPHQNERVAGDASGEATNVHGWAPMMDPMRIE